MKKLLQGTGLLVATFLTVSALALYAQEAPKPKRAMKRAAVLKAAEDLKWMDAPNVKGVQMAVAWGNPQKGPHGAIDKFAAGTEVPLHSHTANFRTVIISGTMVETMEGQSPKELGPGSYAFLPSGAKHTTACKAGADCLFYTQASSAFDVIPAEGAKR